MKCPICDMAELECMTRPYTYYHRGVAATIDNVTGDSCPNCGELLLNLSESQRLSQMMLRMNWHINKAKDKEEKTRRVFEEPPPSGNPLMSPATARAFLSAGLARQQPPLDDAVNAIASLLKNETLDPAIVELVDLAMDIFEDEMRAFRWITRGHALLDGSTPLSCVMNGQEEVAFAVLGPMRYGIP